MSKHKLIAAELFAGVGGFRIAIEKTGGTVVFSNQWEPSTKVQHASDVYVARFGSKGHVNEDIAIVESIPVPFNLLVGGFPCQDYSVAKSLASSNGLVGKKGVLWWEIHRLIEQHQPDHILLENVDRLLKSPSQQKGRDFAVMLRTLMDVGYGVQWAVINAADYGFAQRRRRVFIYASRIPKGLQPENFIGSRIDIFSQAFPGKQISNFEEIDLHESAPAISNTFNFDGSHSPFQRRGFAFGGRAHTFDIQVDFDGTGVTLGDVIEPSGRVPDSFWIADEDIPKWEFLKGSKKLERTHKQSGFQYLYSEGPVRFPDPLDSPSRTILTAEGGATPSRFKHAIIQEGRLRRLLPVELERLNGFPEDWTRTGLDSAVIPDSRRAFFMGNALVVGVIERILKAISLQITP